MARIALKPEKLELPESMPVNQIDWDSEESCRAYALSKLERMQAVRRKTPDFDDDDFPKVQNLAGTGAVAASYVKNPEVSHEETTNYLEAPIRDWQKDVDKIGFDSFNRYYRAQMWMLRALVEAWDGSFGIVPFVHFDPLDLAYQWRGTELFLDYYEHPEELTSLLEKATDAILRLEKHMRRHYFHDYGYEGTFMGAWTPGSYLSCDAGDMGGPEALETFGLPYTQRVVDGWGGAYLHHHELGIHQIPTWSQCRGLTIQFCNRDPNTAHLAQTMTEELLETTFRVPLGFIATYDEFKENADFWAHGRCAVAVRCDDREQAREIVKKLEKLRNF